MVIIMSREERLQELKTKKIKAMLANPVVINNHTGREENITGLVEFVNPEKGIACCFDARYYSLNACLLKEDGLHCSTVSIAGVLQGAYPDADQLAKYNDEHQLFPGDRIKCIYRPDGSVVFPNDCTTELARIIQLKHSGMKDLGLRLAE